MRILVDMDGVIADFETGFFNLWCERYPDRPVIALEDRTDYNLTHQYPEEDKTPIFRLITSPGFIRSLPPMPGAADALAEMLVLGLEVFICTSPMKRYKNVVLEKYDWVNEHLGSTWVERIIMTRDKTLVRADVLIDDRPEVEGVEVPAWEHVFYDQPYNRSVQGKSRLTWANWKQVLGLP